MRTSPTTARNERAAWRRLTDALGNRTRRAFVHLDYEGDHKPEHSVSRVPSGHHAGVAVPSRDLPAP